MVLSCRLEFLLRQYCCLCRFFPAFLGRFFVCRAGLEGGLHIGGMLTAQGLEGQRDGQYAQDADNSGRPADQRLRIGNETAVQAGGIQEKAYVLEGLFAGQLGEVYDIAQQRLHIPVIGAGQFVDQVSIAYQDHLQDTAFVLGQGEQPGHEGEIVILEQVRVVDDEHDPQFFLQFSRG